MADTVGGRPVLRTRFPERGEDRAVWRLVEELGLGNAVGDGPEGFGDIRDIAVDAAGRIYVLDFASKEVRVFGRDGAYLRTMAREGEGPGEIRYRNAPSRRITWRPPGQLWIGGGREYTVLDSLGNELRRTSGRRYPGMFFPGEVPSTSNVVAAGTDGSLYSVVNVFTAGSPAEVGVSHAYVVRSPVSADHELLPGDTLAIETRSMTETGAGRETRATRGRGTVSVQSVQAEDSRFVWAAGHDGTVWLAHRSRYRFDRLAFTGDTVLTVLVGNVPPLPADDPEFVPVLAAVASSPEGWLWVRRENPVTDGGSTWDVLDNCGRHLATVSASVSLWRVEVGAGGVLHGVSSDDLGVDYVHRFRLEGEAGTGVEVGVRACRHPTSGGSLPTMIVGTSSSSSLTQAASPSGPKASGMGGSSGGRVPT